jgi:hypothetical protein
MKPPGTPLNKPRMARRVTERRSMRLPHHRFRLRQRVVCQPTPDAPAGKHAPSLRPRRTVYHGRRARYGFCGWASCSNMDAQRSMQTTMKTPLARRCTDEANVRLWQPLLYSSTGTPAVQTYRRRRSGSLLGNGRASDFEWASVRRSSAALRNNASDEVAKHPTSDRCWSQPLPHRGTGCYGEPETAETPAAPPRSQARAVQTRHKTTSGRARPICRATTARGLACARQFESCRRFRQPFRYPVTSPLIVSARRIPPRRPHSPRPPLTFAFLFFRRAQCTACSSVPQAAGLRFSTQDASRVVVPRGRDCGRRPAEPR